METLWLTACLDFHRALIAANRMRRVLDNGPGGVKRHYPSPCNPDGIQARWQELNIPEPDRHGPALLNFSLIQRSIAACEGALLDR